MSWSKFCSWNLYILIDGSGWATMLGAHILSLWLLNVSLRSSVGYEIA